MKMNFLLVASTLALVACGGTEVETAETTDTVEAYETDTAALPSADQPPLEGDSPFVDEGTEVRDDYAAMDATVRPGEYREPIEADAASDTALGAAPTNLAGRYDVEIEGQDQPAVLVVEEGETPDTFAGTFDGQPVDIAQTEDRFTFDAPVTMDGEEQLMTFSGLSRDGLIEEGQVEAQGDGRSMTYTATRVDDAMMTPDADTTDSVNDYDRPLDDADLNDTGLNDAGLDDVDPSDSDLIDAPDADGTGTLETGDDLGTDDPLLDQ